MVASVVLDSTTQMAPKSLEELSRHLRRERIKLERHLSDDTCDSQQFVQEDDAHKKRAASREKIKAVDDTIVGDGGVNAKLDKSESIAEKKDDDVSKSGTKSRSSKSTSHSTSDGDDTPILLELLNSGSTNGVPKATRKIGLPSARQATQRYAKLKSMQMKPRVSSSDLWLIRQTPKLSGSGPDDEVSIYPDTMSVMSIDTVIRSNILIVEEVITEEGRTCYMI